jgi:hypothetical protein
MECKLMSRCRGSKPTCEEHYANAKNCFAGHIRSSQAATVLGSAEFNGSISVQSTDELRVLVELLCHTKGVPGFDIRIARLRKEAVMLWEGRK